MTSPILDTLPVLVIDCQTTGATPDRGHLLEIGWATVVAKECRTRDEIPINTHLVQLPEGVDIPRPIRRLTGITPESLSDAHSPARVWAQLSRAAGRPDPGIGTMGCPAVIHYARFETPFLRRLHQAHAPEVPFPFDIICTHEIAVRLLPELPRRGLRALAGYIGRPIGELKRSADHVQATARLWVQFVKQLRRHYDITRLGDLRRWLSEPADRCKGGRVYPMPESARLSLPPEPGIYRMHRGNGDVLYVGKARSLRSRVNSYFRKKARHPEHILEMLTQAKDISLDVTGTALEAALAEADEIKHLSPPYNRALRDGNRSLCYTVKDFSNVSPEPTGAFTVGPFPSERIPIALAEIRRAIEGGTVAARPAAVLGFSPEFAPDPDVFSDGVDRFKIRHDDDLCAGHLHRALMRIGRRLWQERHCVPEEPDADASLSCDASEDRDEEEWEWDPERVADMMEGILVHAGHLIRRARWLCQLQEATIAWGPDEDPRLLHVLILEKGAPAGYRILAGGQSVPVPRGYLRKMALRRARFDTATYDRLRVLTTELRRLVREGRSVVVRVSPSVSLGSKTIARLLQWV
ncbi:Excinuclease ABC subunit C [Olavius algarvensis associated proteobacterium Delta 3]|nr:Excinuclease ABC subunit C [Olavius algarvensis associated proteobacterium Delta 3]